jgi:hypothetical protein
MMEQIECEDHAHCFLTGGKTVNEKVYLTVL